MELYADLDPAQLLAFLISSQSYTLSTAFQLCQSRGLLREQVPPTAFVYPVLCVWRRWYLFWGAMLVCRKLLLSELIGVLPARLQCF